MPWFLSRRSDRGSAGAICGMVVRVIAVACALALVAVAVPRRSPPEVWPFSLVNVGGGSGGVSGQTIWAQAWWNGSPEGPGPYVGPPPGGAAICIWHDLGPGLANLDGGLSEAGLPLSFWAGADSGGHPGIWGVNEWAINEMSQPKAAGHFDLVACPEPGEVPPSGGDVEADVPLALPPKGPPLYVWLFWDTVPDPSGGSLPGIIGHARSKTRLPTPVIGTSPSHVGGVADSTVVNIPTWLWVDASLWHTTSAIAAGKGYVATVWATPIDVTWSAYWDFSSPSEDPQGGTTFGPEVLDQTCGGPGVVYNPDINDQSTYCSFDFTQSSFGTGQPLVAAVTWQVFWALSDHSGAVGGEGDLGTVVTQASRPLRVMQVESVISGG